MPQRTYLQLPINTDIGFPQAFRLRFNNITYQIVIYVNILADGPAQADTNGIYTLPDVGAFMVMRVLREDTNGTRVIFQRKIIPNLEYEAAEDPRTAVPRHIETLKKLMG